MFSFMHLRDSSDMSAWWQTEEGNLLKFWSASRTLVPPHCILSRYPHITENKVNVLFLCVSVSLSVNIMLKQGFVWKTDCSSCNLLVYHLSGTHIWSSTCSELTENQSWWCTGSVKKLTENNIISIFYYHWRCRRGSLGLTVIWGKYHVWQV